MRINIWTYFILGEAENQKAKGKKKKKSSGGGLGLIMLLIGFFDPLPISLTNPYILDQNSGSS
jgi:hypothetical protein